MSKGASEPSEIERLMLELSTPFDRRLIRKREGPKNKKTGVVLMLDYVEWHTVADRLNAVAPGWTFEIKNLIPVGDQDYLCHGALTIAGVTRENVGAGDGDADKGPKSAVSDCIKRCAVLFGCGAELYRDEQQQRWAVARGEKAREARETPRPPFDPTPHEQVADILAGRAPTPANPLENPLEALKMAIARTGQGIQEFCSKKGIRKWSDLSDDRIRELIAECNDIAREAAVSRV